MCALHAPRICRDTPARRSIDRDLTRAPAASMPRAEIARAPRLAGEAFMSAGRRREGKAASLPLPLSAAVRTGGGFRLPSPRCGNEHS
jgi:hypothetical protein